MRGSFKKKQAKVISVNHKTIKVFIEGIQRSKKDGAKVNVPLDPRALQIVVLHQDDKQRNLSLNKPGNKETKVEKKAEVKTEKSNSNLNKEKSGEKNASK
jgi:ribosomal protein L24